MYKYFFLWKANMNYLKNKPKNIFLFLIPGAVLTWIAPNYYRFKAIEWNPTVSSHFTSFRLILFVSGQILYFEQKIQPFDFIFNWFLCIFLFESCYFFIFEQKHSAPLSENEVFFCSETPFSYNSNKILSS